MHSQLSTPWVRTMLIPQSPDSSLRPKGHKDTPGMLLLHGGLLAVDGFADTDGL